MSLSPNPRLAFAFLLVIASAGAHASFARPGIEFSHKDWELACDNTGTCRAAGYQSMDSDPAVSVLLTRKAGPDQPVRGQLMIGHYGDDAIPADLPDRIPLLLHIDGRAKGQVKIDRRTFSADLSSTDVSALLASLRRSPTIEWSSGAHRWRLSDEGATAVLLKMDEHQGRLGTPGALVRKGSRPESEVPPAVAAPRIVARPLAPAKPADSRFPTNPPKALLDTLRASIDVDRCWLREDTSKPLELDITRLSEGKVLLAADCWGAAYNFGQIVWVANDEAPFAPVVVTTDASYIDDDGTIHATHKGRGLGDCWSRESWTWNGSAYVPSRALTTGMCRLVAPGGTWDLPTLVTEVIRETPASASAMQE